ncbi:MAG: mersacidin/lichenicidin family type 2 lantibiotic [Ktedonobacteraceae bacterium]
MQIDIIRAWKDEAYRQSLSEEERLALPENPVGEIELTDADLEAVYGGRSALVGCSVVCGSGAVCNSGVCGSAICNSVAICQSVGC